MSEVPFLTLQKQDSSLSHEIPQRRSSVFIVSISACSDNETIQTAFAAGANMFIAKPFTMDSFNTAVREVLVQKALLFKDDSVQDYDNSSVAPMEV